MSNVDAVAIPSEVRKQNGLISLMRSPRLFFTALLLACTFFTFGYDGGVINGVLALPGFHVLISPKTHFLRAGDISLIVGLPNIGVLFGLPLSTFLADRYGRRRALIVAAVIGVVAGALQTAAFSLATFIVGRVVAYVAIFMFLSLSTPFLAEVAPSNIRGLVVGTSIVLIDFAAVVTAGINWDMSTVRGPLSYRLPLGLQVAFPIFLIIGFLFIDDSPTSYLIRSKDKKAEQCLRSLRRGHDEVEIRSELQALKAQSALRAEEVKIPLSALFKGVNLRRTLLACSIPVMQSMSGIAFATNYATIFLKQVVGGSNPYVLTLGLAILALGGAVTGIFVVDWMGRRTLALSSFVIIFLIDLGIGILGFFPHAHGYHHHIISHSSSSSSSSSNINNSNNNNIGKAIAALSLMFAFFFAAGFGPLAYIVSSEMPTARLRNKTNALVFLCVACVNTLVLNILPFISRPDAGNLGAKTYLIFAGWMLGCIVIIGLWFPETKGRSPAELDHMFEHKVPARRFKSYVCALPSEEMVKGEVRLGEVEVPLSSSRSAAMAGRRDISQYEMSIR
ncbi:hypothetical protein MBLNU457_3185t1 [Dothideomycetes sp. NU457]